jgi:O-antigen/teichoic acid export membrane protein
MLYFRQIIILLVNLYVVRKVLLVIGVEDFGIYNVVGGLVSMFSFLTGSLSSAAQRFFSYELGKEHGGHYSKIFTMMFYIYLIFGLMILIIAETIGLWFIYNKLVIPSDRFIPALLVYQFSIFSFFFSMFVTPFNASVIAHEDMSVFAAISIIEAFLKLGSVLVLSFISYDGLILYGFLSLIVVIANSSLYIIYCIKKYTECRVIRVWDVSIFRELTYYLGWNMIGSFIGVVKNYGINIILNLFFGPIVNAARAVAYQIRNTALSFAQNMTTALRPQITQNYAAKNLERMFSIAFRGSKFSFFLVFLISLPIILTADGLLGLWLGLVPENAAIFTILVLIANMIEVISLPLVTVAMATGNIKKYEIVIGIVGIQNILLSYILLHIGYGAIFVFIINIIIELALLFSRIILLKSLVGLSMTKYSEDVLIPIMLVSGVSLFLSFLVKTIVSNYLLMFITVLLIVLVSIVVIGLDSVERQSIVTYFFNSLGLIFKRQKDEHNNNSR